MRHRHLPSPRVPAGRRLCLPLVLLAACTPPSTGPTLPQPAAATAAAAPTTAAPTTATAAAAAPTTAAASPATLAGTWVVDLRGGPSDEPYTQPFVVVAIDEAQRSLRGSFYNSDISWSRINTAWGKVVITFITSDGEGEYVHTATLQGDTLVGSSTARHRNMLVPWTATRVR